MKTPAKLFLGYLSICIIGFTLLSLPFFQIQDIAWIDNWFISISSVSTTGLIPFQIVDNYNFGGQVIILILVQLGGIGYMTFAASVLYKIHYHWKPEETDLLKSDLGLPSRYNFIDLLKIKLLLALAVETIGAIALSFFFFREGVENPIWNGIFHSVSAFCTAGMSLFRTGFEGFTTHTGINFTISSLCFLGGIGFVVFADFWQILRRKRKALTFTSRIILRGSTIVILIGSILFFILEPAIQHLGTIDKIQISIFQTISASSTAGFNSINFNLLSIGNLFLLCLIMIIGASPTGTGGGLKLTGLAIVLAHMKSSFQGLSKTVLQNTIVPSHRVRLALATFSFYIIMLVLSALCLTFLHPNENLEKILFEAISALSTVGLTMGLTYDLGLAGKILLSITMLIGRIGFLTLGLILFSDKQISHNLESKDLAI